MTTEFDFSDPKIRELVRMGHQPVDIWVHRSSHIPESRRLSAIRCATCHYSWPCPTVKELRAWEKDQERDVGWIQMER